MKALNEVKLPRIANASDFSARQSEQMNQMRMNQNFREIGKAVTDAEERIEKLPSEIIKKVNVSAAYVKSIGSDGLWTWRKWSDGTIEAWTTTLPVSVNCTTASGGMFYADTSIELPSDLLDTLECVTITPISTDAILAQMLSASVSSLSARIYCTTNANVSVSFGVFAIGK